MEISKIKAILLVKDHGKESEGKMRLEGSNEEGLYLTGERFETQVVTKYDMKEPMQENFETTIKDVLEQKEDLKKDGVELTFLTDYTEE